MGMGRGDITGRYVSIFITARESTGGGRGRGGCASERGDKVGKERVEVRSGKGSNGIKGKQMKRVKEKTGIRADNKFCETLTGASDEALDWGNEELLAG